MRRTARLSVVSLVGLAMAAGVGLGAAPASAASVTVRSPVEGVPGSVDITSTTVDFDPAQGRLAVTVVLRGTAGRGRGEGPTYSVLLYGPRDATGGRGQAVVSVASIGVPSRNGFPVPTGTPVTGPLVFNPVGTAVDEVIPIEVRYVGNRVEYRASSDRLKNLPVRYFEVQTSLDRVYIPTDPTTDSVRGRLNG